MRSRPVVIALTLLVANPLAGQSSGEFLFTMMDGGSFVRVLPPDWRPVFRDNFLYITPRDRILTMDLAAVQPLHPDDVRGRSEVKVIFRTLDGGRITRYFLLPEGRDHIDESPWKGNLYLLDEQTLVRKGSYTTELD